MSKEDEFVEPPACFRDPDVFNPASSICGGCGYKYPCALKVANDLLMDYAEAGKISSRALARQMAEGQVKTKYAAEVLSELFGLDRKSALMRYLRARKKWGRRDEE